MYIYSQHSRQKAGSINSKETRREMSFEDYVHPRKKHLQLVQASPNDQPHWSKPLQPNHKMYTWKSMAGPIVLHLLICMVNYCIYNINWMIRAIYSTEYLPPMSFWARLSSNSTFISLATVEGVTCISSVHQ